MSAKPRQSPPGDPARNPAGARTPAGTTSGGRRRWLPRTRTKRVLLWLAVAALAVFLAGVAAFALYYSATDIPDPNKDFQTETTFVYYAGGRREAGQFATQNRQSIPLSQVPDDLENAVIAAENRTFWTDRGIDPRGILRAAFQNVQGGPTQGASTITQQYVKILYLTQERTLSRKLQEAVLSLKIHRQLSKEKILEGYLNTIYFGRGAYGVQAAARAFFGVDASELTLRQSAVLASVLNSPTALDPANGRDNRAELRDRYRYTLDGMAQMGTISASAAERASRRLPPFPKIEQESRYGGQAGHLLSLVRSELLDLGFSEREIDGGGLRVTTTFTPEAMAAAEDGVAAQRPEGLGRALHIGVASVEPGTGALRGFYAGQDYLDSQINWAVAGGMAGSTFKVFAIATALKEGFSIEDTFDGNSPYLLPDGTDIENQGNASYGSAISLIEATENSVNTAFVDLTLAIPDGPAKIIETAREMGVPDSTGKPDPGIPGASVDLQPVTGVALGSAQVSPINMANAYATVAAGGRRARVHVIERVVDRRGREQYRFQREPERVLSPEIAADVSFTLQQVVSSGSGTAALGLGRPAAGKTGTATNAEGGVSSSWFVGYTPQMSTAVMYVRGKGRDSLDAPDFLPYEYFGGSYPARTWTDVMARVLGGLPIEEFPPPAFVDGEAPTEGHDPYTPPPEPSPSETRQPEPSPTGEPSPTDGPTSEEPSPTDEPSEPPTPPEPPGQPSEPPGGQSPAALRRD